MQNPDAGHRVSAPRSDTAEPPIWPIETLIGTGREALIRHDAQLYRLRITAQNKLILTK